MNFNLADYEQVEDRLAKFHVEHPTGRVITEMKHYDESRVVFMAYLFNNYEDEKPISTGFAEETRGEGGMVNKTSHLENCETSAIGRALANAGYAPKGKRPSREEMLKVQRMESVNKSETTTKDINYCTGVGTEPSCGRPVAKNVKEFSLKTYGKVLCFDCQKKAQRLVPTRQEK